MRLEFASGLARGRAISAAALAGALIVTAGPADARWFYEPQPQPVFERVPDPRAALRAKKRRAEEAAREKLVRESRKKQEKLPTGPLYIVISIKQQRLTVYANGEPVAHSPVSTGVPGHPTPQGVFSVIQKNLHHRSNIYSGAPMPYMQRITWSGVAMHEGKLPGYPASHGCIRLPREFAQRLWGVTKIGVRVIIAQDDLSPAEIAHSRLFATKAELPAAVSAVEPAPARVRFATVASVVDAPLKGTIDANETARVETAIDRAVQVGIAEAEAYRLNTLEADEPREPEKGVPVASAKDPMLRPGPISVYISRKTGKLYVRKGFDEVFETPVTIAEPDQPLGTHVFNALKGENDAVRWNVVSLPTERVVKKGKYLETYVRGEKLRKELVPPVYEVMPYVEAKQALDRITIPEVALARINELMSPGASLIISDLAMSYETGKGTDFIVLTR